MEDLKVKIGTKDEQFWTDIKEKAEADVFSSEKQIEMNKLIIDYAEKKIKQEEDKKNGK